MDLPLAELARLDRAGAFDAFIRALETGTELGTSEGDNLRTLAPTNAVVDSARRGGLVAVT